MTLPPPQPVVAGWFTTGPEPHLVGGRCPACATVVFPPTATWCPNPGCRGDRLDEVALSRRGTVWSYTTAAYKPPPPYIPRTEPYEPFAIAAVELADEGLVVLGQVADGVAPEDLAVGQEVELVVETLVAEEDRHELTWRWRPVTSEADR